MQGLRKKMGLPLLLCGLLLIALLAFAACGKEEKATPTKAAGSPTAAATKAAATGSPAAAATGAATAAAQPTSGAKPIDLSGYSATMQKYLQSNDPNKYPADKSTPKRGGEINGPFGPPPDWDIVTSQNVSLMSMGPLIYSGLVRPDLVRGKEVVNPTPKAYMVESWQQATDGLSWTFKMRKGMTWQNKPPVNGRPVTVQDMKYGLDQLRTQFAIKGDFADVTDVQVVDDQTFKVITSRPFPDLIDTLMTMGSMIISKECFESEDCRKKNPVGAGPYMLETVEPNVKVVLVKNPNFWLKDDQGVQLPYLDKVTTLVFSDPVASIAAFRTGKIDISYVYGTRDLQDILKSNPDTIFGLQGPAHLYTLNNTVMHLKQREGAPWNDARVRLAMSMATDRKSIVDNAFDGLGTPGQPVPFEQLGLSFFPSFKDMEAYGKAWKYDPTEAKKLLADAGYANGFKVKVATLGTSGTAWNGLLIWQQNWKAVGIDMEIVQAADGAAYYGLMTKASYDDLYYQTSMNFTWTRPSKAAYNTLYSKGSNNWSKINDPKLDDLLSKADAATTLQQKTALLKQVVQAEGENPHMIYGIAPFRFEMMQPWTRNMAGYPDGQIYGWGMRTLIDTWINK